MATTSAPPWSLPAPQLTDDANIETAVVPLRDRLAVVLDANFPKTVLTQQPVLEVGQAGQIRAGRQLAVADFTAMGLSAPIGLWNLSDLTDASGNGRTLSNKGVVPFGVGINGLASTAAVFAGSTGQALYLPDTGAADPFRIRTGSWGCWFRTAKRGVVQTLLAKWSTAVTQCYIAYVNGSNGLSVGLTTDGAASSFIASGVSDVSDDRWHFAVGTADGSTMTLYLDGVSEASLAAGPIFTGNAPALNFGANTADAATAAAAPTYGRVDEGFVTADVLTPDQVRLLYAARFTHTLAAVPSAVRMSVRRKRRGSAAASTNFPSQPLRLHNFTFPGFLNDEGSNAIALTSNVGTGSIVAVAGADGSNGPSGAAVGFAGAHLGLSATDAGLPAGTAARSYGCWFKGLSGSVTQVILAWGSGSNAVDAIWLNSNVLSSLSGTDAIGLGIPAMDGVWHHVVVVADNSAADGVRRKIYFDGRFVGGSTVMGSVTLGGANRFRIGANFDGSTPFTGQVDGAFVHSIALTADQVRTLYNVSALQLPPTPKDSGGHVESLSSADLLAVLDTLEATDLVDLKVTA